MERGEIFKGKHNRSKSKVLIFLAIRQQQGYGELVSARHLHEKTGVPLATLRDRLRLWYRWKYLTRRAVDDHGRAVFRYGVAGAWSAVRGRCHAPGCLR